MFSKIETLSFICLLVISVSLSAQGSFQAPLVKESLLLDISQGDIVVVVGERGHILTGTNYQDMKQISFPSKITLTTVATIGQKIWAAGHDASILYSADNGENWQLQLTMPELDRPFLDILFFDDNAGIAVGAYGLFYRTVDGGSTWEKEMHASVLPADDIEYLDSIKDDSVFYEEELSFILPHFNRLSFYDGKLYMAGEAGMLAVSTDIGKSWKRLDINYQGSFFDVKEISSGGVIAAGLRGNIFVKQSDDKDWQAIQTCVTTSLNSIVDAPNGDIFITGNNGVVMSLDRANIFSDSYQAPNEESCAMHSSVKRLKNNLSDSVLNGLVIDDVMLAVTASGLKQIELK